MKRLKNINVEYISLVRMPANGFDLILKNSNAKSFNITKYDEERKVAYGIVYAPEDLDSQGEFADRYEIEKAAYNFMKSGRLKNVDINHNFEPVNCYVCESWLVKDGDPYFYNKPGAWAVGIKVEDDDIWNALKAGELTGISMAGNAEKEDIIDGDSVIKGFFDIFKKFLKGNLKEAKDMEEIKKFEERLNKSEEQSKQQFEDLKKCIEEIKVQFSQINELSERLSSLEKSRKTEDKQEVKKSISEEIL